MAVGADDP